jgi:hypothetical protein
MNKQQAHQILDNYKSSSLLLINQALICLGDLDVHQYSTSPYRTLRKDGVDQGLAGPCEVQDKGARGMSIGTVVRHWIANQATYGRIEGEA